MRDNLLIGLKVPRDLLGLPEGSNKGQADVTYEAFKTRIKNLQRAIGRTVELEIFKRHLDLVWNQADVTEAIEPKKDAKFVDTEVETEMVVPEILWEEPEGEDEKERIDTVLKLRSAGLVTLEKAINLLPEEYREEEEGLAELEKDVQDKKDMEKQAMQSKGNFFKKEHLNLHESAGRDEQIPNKKEWPKEWKTIENLYANFVTNKLEENINQLKQIITPEKLETFKIEITEKRNVDLDDVGRVMNQFYRDVREKGVEMPKRAYELGIRTAEKDSGKQLTFKLEDYDTVAFLDEKNVDLLLTVSAELTGRIKSSIRLGVVKGESIAKITKRLEEIEDLYDNRIETIARTEVSNAVNMGRLNGYEQAGIEEVEWLAADDACPECAAKDGKIMSIQESQGEIPLHPNCRCTWVPVVK
jgi:SPP1 gp7 family putative phage head morphogenesis protein